MKLLDCVEITTPCPADWSSMRGDDRVRFCGICKLNVYDIAGMSGAEAEALLASEGEVCGRLFRRTDGTVLTRDCPGGVEDVRKRARALTGALGAGAALVLGVFGWQTYRVVAAEAVEREKQAQADEAQQARLEKELDEHRRIKAMQPLTKRMGRLKLVR